MLNYTTMQLLYRNRPTVWLIRELKIKAKKVMLSVPVPLVPLSKSSLVQQATFTLSKIWPLNAAISRLDFTLPRNLNLMFKLQPICLFYHLTTMGLSLRVAKSVLAKKSWPQLNVLWSSAICSRLHFCSSILSLV